MVGAADGVIIATIITIHMGISHPRSGPAAAPGMTMAIGGPEAIIAEADIPRLM
jgi:hypothetical protein